MEIGMLFRRYSTKKRDYVATYKKQIEKVMNKINKRPQKCAGFKTPNQIF